MKIKYYLELTTIQWVPVENLKKIKEWQYGIWSFGLDIAPPCGMILTHDQHYACSCVNFKLKLGRRWVTGFIPCGKLVLQPEDWWIENEGIGI